MKRFQLGLNFTRTSWTVFDEDVWNYVFEGTQEECINWIAKNYPNEDYVLFT